MFYYFVITYSELSRSLECITHYITGKAEKISNVYVYNIFFTLSARNINSLRITRKYRNPSQVTIKDWTSPLPFELFSLLDALPPPTVPYYLSNLPLSTPPKNWTPNLLTFYLHATKLYYPPPPLLSLSTILPPFSNKPLFHMSPFPPSIRNPVLAYHFLVRSRLLLPSSSKTVVLWSFVLALRTKIYVFWSLLSV